MREAPRRRVGEAALQIRRLEILEHFLAQDVAKFRRALLERDPDIGRSELHKRVEAYTARRQAELGLLARTEA
jgi:hypothetical protein